MGRFPVATNRADRLLWYTPKAKQLLTELYPFAAGQDAALPARIIERLLQPAHREQTSGAGLYEAWRRESRVSRRTGRAEAVAMIAALTASATAACPGPDCRRSESRLRFYL